MCTANLGLYISIFIYTRYINLKHMIRTIHVWRKHRTQPATSYASLKDTAFFLPSRGFTATWGHLGVGSSPLGGIDGPKAHPSSAATTPNADTGNNVAGGGRR